MDTLLCISKAIVTNSFTARANKKFSKNKLKRSKVKDAVWCLAAFIQFKKVNRRMVNLNLNVIYFTDKSVNCGHISGANSFELAFAVPNRRDLMLKKNSLILLVPETSFWNADVMLSLEKLIQMLVCLDYVTLKDPFKSFIFGSAYLHIFTQWTTYLGSMPFVGTKWQIIAI